MAWEIYNDNIICDNVSSEQTAVEQFLPESPEYYAGIADGNIIQNYETVTFVHEPATAATWCFVSLGEKGAVELESQYSRSIGIQVNANTSSTSRTCKIYLQNSAGVKSTNYIQITQNGSSAPTYIMKWFEIQLTREERDNPNIFIIFTTTNLHSFNLLGIPSNIPMDRVSQFAATNPSSYQCFLNYPEQLGYTIDTINDTAFSNHCIKVLLCWQKKSSGENTFSILPNNSVLISKYNGYLCTPTFISSSGGALMDDTGNNVAIITQTLDKVPYNSAISNSIAAYIGRIINDNIYFYRYVKTDVTIENASTDPDNCSQLTTFGVDYYGNTVNQ